MEPEERFGTEGRRGVGTLLRELARAVGRIPGFAPASDARRILFVCTENICRSPMAEGLLRFHLARSGPGNSFRVASAGTIVSQPGARPDLRARQAAAAAGVDLGRIRASRVTERMLAESDFVFAMDRANLRDLLALCPEGRGARISLLLSHLPEIGFEDVPDPYYGSVRGFYENFDLIEQAVLSLIARGVIFE
jgi:protein-tyrosine phosphatase